MALLRRRGRGRMDTARNAPLVPKQIFLDPLHRRRQQRLCSAGEGQFRQIPVKVLRNIYWRNAGVDIRLQVVVIKPLGYRLRNGSKLLYRQPAFLICTDPEPDLATLIQACIKRGRSRAITAMKIAARRGAGAGPQSQFRGATASTPGSRLQSSPAGIPSQFRFRTHLRMPCRSRNGGPSLLDLRWRPILLFSISTTSWTTTPATRSRRNNRWLPILSVPSQLKEQTARFSEAKVSFRPIP